MLNILSCSLIALSQVAPGAEAPKKAELPAKVAPAKKNNDAPAKKVEEPIDPKSQQLVGQLGHKSFRLREAAATDLIRQGPVALGAIKQGLEHKDAEIAERCRLLYPFIRAMELSDSIRLFTEKNDKDVIKKLPGAERFLKITGDDPNARKLYADMIAAHGEKVILAETEPKKASEAITLFTQQIYNKWRAGINAGRYDQNNLFDGEYDLTYFFFMSSDKRLPPDTSYQRGNLMLNGTKVNDFIQDNTPGAPKQKLFIEWLREEKNINLVNRGLQLAGQYNVKEVLPMAREMLARKEVSAYQKGNLMMVLPKLDPKIEAKEFESFFDDKNIITTVNFGGGGGNTTVQMRDVALGLAISVSGQSINDFGFSNGRFNGINNGNQIPSSYIYLGFTDDDSRNRAFEKYKEFKEKKAKGEIKADPKKEELKKDAPKK